MGWVYPKISTTDVAHLGVKLKDKLIIKDRSSARSTNIDHARNILLCVIFFQIEPNVIPQADINR
jgi:hypothetical protein